MKQARLKPLFGLFLIVALAGCTAVSGDQSRKLAQRLRQEALLTAEPSKTAKNHAADTRPDHLALAEVLAKRGFFDIALVQLEAAASSGESGPALGCLKGVCLREKGELTAARQAFESVLGQSPDYPAAHAGLGLIAAIQGDADQAVSCYQRAVARDPASAAFLNNLAVALLAQNQTQAAIARLKQAIAIAPEYRRAWNNLGMAYVLSGKETAALKAFEAAGTPKTAANNLAFVRWRAGQPQSSAGGEFREKGADHAPY